MTSELKQQGRSVPRTWVVCAIFLLAAGERLALVRQELREHSVPDVVSFNWDSREYVHLANNLATTGRYVDDANPDPSARRVSRFFGLLRTPGYPLFLAAFQRWGSLAGALWAQALIGSLVPICVLYLGCALFGSERIGVGAALVAAFSSTGVGLSGIFLVDVLAGVLTVTGWALLCRGIYRGSFTAYAASGVLFAAGVLVKPSLLYWPLLIPVVGWLLARGIGRPVRWRPLVLTTLLPVVTTAGWCYRNSRIEGGFTYCIVDAQNLRHFLSPLIEETIRSGGKPTADNIWKAHYGPRDRDWEDMAQGTVTAVELGRRQRAESIAIILRHPFVAARCVMSCAIDSWINGWPYTRDELKSNSIVRWLMYRADQTWFLYGLFVGLPLILIGLIEPLTHAARLGDPVNRRRFFVSMALLITLAYFLMLSGTSFSVGFRTLYPAEFAILLLAASGVAAATRLITRLAGHRTRRSLFQTEGNAPT